MTHVIERLIAYFQLKKTNEWLFTKMQKILSNFETHKQIFKLVSFKFDPTIIEVHFAYIYLFFTFILFRKNNF